MAASLMNFEKESHEGKHWAKLAPHSFNQRMAAPSRTIRSAKRRDLRKNHSIRWASAVKLVVQLGHVTSNKWLHRTMQLEGWGVTVLPKGANNSIHQTNDNQLRYHPTKKNLTYAIILFCIVYLVRIRSQILPPSSTCLTQVFQRMLSQGTWDRMTSSFTYEFLGVVCASWGFV